MDISAAETRGFYGWKMLAAGAVMYFAMTGLLLYSFPVFLPFLCDAFSWSREQVSWSNTLAMIVIGIASPFAGMFIARYGVRRAIVLGNIVCLASFVILSFHSQLWQLYFAYGAIFGLGFCLGGILPMTTLINNWFVRKRSLALSLLLAAGGLGGFVTVQFLMAMITGVGWRYTYLAIAALTLLILVLLPALTVKNKPEDLGQTPDGIHSGGKIGFDPSKKNLHSTPIDFTAAEAVKTPALWFLIAFSTAHMFGLQGFIQHQVAHLMDIGIPDSRAATAYSVFVLISVVGRLGLGFLGLKYHMHLLTIISMLILILGMTLIFWSDTLPMIFMYNAIVGIGMGASIVAVMNLVPLYFGKTYYPKIMGYVLPFSTIIGGLGNPLAGRIRDNTGSYMLEWKVSIVILAISLVFLILARPPVHPSLKQQVQG